MSSLTSRALFAPVMPVVSRDERIYEVISGYMRTHGGTKTTIDLENGEFAEDRWVIDLGEGIVGNNLFRGRRFNLVPDTDLQD